MRHREFSPPGSRWSPTVARLPESWSGVADVLLTSLCVAVLLVITSNDIGEWLLSLPIFTFGVLH